MRLLVFSDSDAVYNSVKNCKIDEIVIEKITFNRITSLGLTCPDDVYVIDDDYRDKIDEAYLDFLIQIKAEIIVIVSKLERLSAYIEFHVIEYFHSPISMIRMNACINKVVKHRLRLKKLGEHKSDKLVIRNKLEVQVLEFQSIFFMTAYCGIVHVFTEDDTYVTFDSMDRIEEIVPDQFLRVDEEVIVNFDKISGITKISDTKYKLLFSDCNKHTYLTDYMLQVYFEDNIKRNRQKYVVDTIMECIT